MMYVGIDDTDTLETRGTNQLARQIVRQRLGLGDGGNAGDSRDGRPSTA